MAFEELDKIPDIEYYVLVELENVKHIYYIGKLLSSISKNDDLEITFLRNRDKMEGKFYFPDVATVAKSNKN